MLQAFGRPQQHMSSREARFCVQYFPIVCILCSLRWSQWIVPSPPSPAWLPALCVPMSIKRFMNKMRFWQGFPLGIDDPKYPTRLAVLYRFVWFVIMLPFLEFLKTFSVDSHIFAWEMKGKRHQTANELAEILTWASYSSVVTARGWRELNSKFSFVIAGHVQSSVCSAAAVSGGREKGYEWWLMIRGRIIFACQVRARDLPAPGRSFSLRFTWVFACQGTNRNL